MSGTALVTIGENQWYVEVATTTTELINGLSGRASIPAGTGMLFVLPVRQVIAIQTNQMLFPLDAIFIKDNLVLDIAQNINPGNLVQEATPCDGFLEVNSGETDLVEVGDAVDVTFFQQPGFNIASIVTPMTQLAYTAMSLSIFGSALGIIIAAGGLEAATPISEIIATDPAIDALRQAYGDVIVSKALADVPGAEAVELAHKVEFYVHQDLRQRYGDWAADLAITAAPPGDLSTAVEIARTLSQRGVTRTSPATEKVKAVAVGKMKGRSKAKPVRDTKTGIVYRSESAAGMAVAAEYGLDPKDTYSWYAVIKKDPNRFVPA